MEEESLRPLIDFVAKPSEDANALIELTTEELLAVSGGFRGCGLIHIKK